MSNSELTIPFQLVLVHVGDISAFGYCSRKHDAVSGRIDDDLFDRNPVFSRLRWGGWTLVGMKKQEIVRRS